MANGYQPTKGETWGEEPVAHTFDLTHRIRGLSTPTTSTLDTYASFFAVFFSAKTFSTPTQSDHKTTHRDTPLYVYIPPPASADPRSPAPPFVSCRCVCRRVLSCHRRELLRVASVPRIGYVSASGGGGNCWRASCRGGVFIVAHRVAVANDRARVHRRASVRIDRAPLNATGHKLGERR